MRTGMLQRRRVAAAHVTTGETEPQMYPGRVDPEALLTALWGAGSHRADHHQVRVQRLRHVATCLFSAESSQGRSTSAGAAPTWREISFPSRSTTRVGIACTSKRCDTWGASSALTLTSLMLPAFSVASCSSTGLTIRQGPHHGAQISTSTGRVAWS